LFVLAGNDRSDVPFVPAMTEFAAGLGIAEHVRILDNIRAFDNTPFELRHRLLAAADVFTSPIDNLQETFGIAPIEAMACGTPQVVSDWDGYKDTVVHGVTGYRIPSYWMACDGDEEVDFGIGGFGFQGFLWGQSVAIDLPKYQAAVQRLIDDPNLLAAMSAASRARALEVFDWRVVLRSYEALWADLAEEARRLDPADVRAAPFFRAALSRRFAPFPTAMLDGSQEIRISDEGIRLLAGSDPFPAHSSQEQAVIDPATLLATLDAVRRRRGTIDEVAARLIQDQRERRPAALRALLWGIKHGLLECAVTSVLETGGFDPPRVVQPLETR
jgi:hypothetical protein